MMKCYRGVFVTVNKFKTDDQKTINVYPWQNLWTEIEKNIGYEVFILVDDNNFVKDIVFS